jgi:exopolyphosphatase/guanosine-5'-triphosphate,3'-diphosphate pyrophosphatase
VADVADDGSVTPLTRQTEIVRLGQGVDETGELNPEALARTLAAATRFGSELQMLGPDAVRFVATSATRDARNRADFVAGIKAAIGVEPEVIAGEEEAELAFTGATAWLDPDQHPGPYLVVDLGGGSTELVLGEYEGSDSGLAGEAARHVAEAPHPVGGAIGLPKTPAHFFGAYSMDVGSVRLTERRLKSDPPTADEIAAARADVRAMLAKAQAVVPIAQTRTIVGVAGTVTSLAAYHLGLTQFDRDRVNGLALPAAAVRADCAAMLGMTKAKRLALGFMAPGRADIIGAGALIWDEVIAAVAEAVEGSGRPAPEVVASDHDMLDGIVAKLAR